MAAIGFPAGVFLFFLVSLLIRTSHCEDEPPVSHIPAEMTISGARLNGETGDFKSVLQSPNGEYQAVFVATVASCAFGVRATRDERMVWSTPIFDLAPNGSAELKFMDGDLELRVDNVLQWRTRTWSSGADMLQLLNSGSLVLFNSGSKAIVWQSKVADSTPSVTQAPTAPVPTPSASPAAVSVGLLNIALFVLV